MNRPVRRLAVFDFGSNSIKFGLFEAATDGALRRLDEWREMIALGDDAFETGRISEGKARAVEEALTRLRGRMGRVDGMAAAATSAFRSAENGLEMARRFSAAIGVTVEILDGEEEARLLAEGVLRTEGWEGSMEAAVLDIGGGSVEIVRARPGADLEVASLALGAIRLRAEHSPPPDDQPYSVESAESLEAAAARALRGIVPLAADGQCYGSGGGFATLGQMMFGLENGPGIAIARERIEELARTLRAMPAIEAARRYGLPRRRARIMFAGATTAGLAMERLEVQTIRVSWAGLREGLAARLAREMGR